MRVRNRILQLARANRLEFGSVPLGEEDQRQLVSLFPGVLGSIADENIFEFVWQDAGIRIDADYLVHYPDIEEWEWSEAMTCPVPHPHVWIETKASGPEDARDRTYIWDVVRDEGRGFTATPLVFDEQTNSLSYFGMSVAVDQSGVDDLGRRGTVKVYDVLRGYANDYDIDEFFEHANVLARFFRILCQPKVVVEVEPADDKLNRERRRRGRETIVARKTVRISTEAFQYRARETVDGHASPVEHHRRAHKRRYSNGRETMVRECVVNKGQGTVAALPQQFSVV